MDTLLCPFGVCVREVQLYSFFISFYRLALFTGGSVITHELGSGQLSFRRHKQDSPVVTNSTDTQCTSLFIEPVSWMLPLLEGTIEGKVVCSNKMSHIEGNKY